jgi:hypothetical protein
VNHAQYADPPSTAWAIHRQTLGVDDFELSQIAAEFSAISSGELEHHLFDAPRPSEIVRLADKVARHTRSHGWLDQAAAQARIAEWKRHAFAQGEGRANADKVCCRCSTTPGTGPSRGRMPATRSCASTYRTTLLPAT